MKRLQIMIDQDLDDILGRMARDEGRDAHHEVAQALLHSIGDRQMTTSNHVRGETWTFLRRRIGHAGTVGFLDTLQRSPRLEIAHIEHEMEQRALVWSVGTMSATTRSSMRPASR